MGLLRDDFAALVAEGKDVDLARGALAIARLAYPTLDPQPWLRELDALAAGVRARVPAGAAPEDVLAVTTLHLFRECGFRGNQLDYYDPRNSFLNDVLARRAGIPISLAVVLLETGRRLGLPLEGVGFPGHFLVLLPRAGEPLVLDPFFGGREMNAADLRARYRAFVGESAAELPADALVRTDTPGILARMVRNLLRVYLDREDHARALEAVDLLLVLLPESPAEIRLRGLLYEQLECFAAAVIDFRRYLDLTPDARDAEQVRARIARLARAAAALH